VEDDARLRGLLRSHLTALDHRVIEASNGEEALAAFSRAPIAPDLVITDFVMPKMGGGVLATRLRATRADPPILFITGYAGNELGESGVRGAKRWVLQKPFNRGAFTSMVQGILNTVERSALQQPREAAV
jgi:DNA-binding response OmpR family regulator